MVDTGIMLVGTGGGSKDKIQNILKWILGVILACGGLWLIVKGAIDIIGGLSPTPKDFKKAAIGAGVLVIGAVLTFFSADAMISWANSTAGDVPTS